MSGERWAVNGERVRGERVRGERVRGERVRGERFEYVYSLSQTTFEQ